MFMKLQRSQNCTLQIDVNLLFFTRKQKVCVHVSIIICIDCDIHVFECKYIHQHVTNIVVLKPFSGKKCYKK